MVLYPSICQATEMAKPSPTHAGDPSLVAIGEALRRARLALGMSQEGLALLADLIALMSVASSVANIMSQLLT